MYVCYVLIVFLVCFSWIWPTFHLDFSKRTSATITSANPNCQRPRSGSSTACFKVVREPFMQLLSIHSFMKSGNSMQQVLLCFVLMSLRRKTVFDRLPALLDEQPSVRDRHRFREGGMEHLAPMSTSCQSTGAGFTGRRQYTGRFVY